MKKRIIKKETTKKETTKKRTTSINCNIISIFLLISIIVSGCNTVQKAETDTSAEDTQAVTEQEISKAEQVMDLLTDVYKQAAEENKLADLETIRSTVNYLGERGYAAIDSKNQVDMTQSEQVQLFCEQVNSKEKAELSMIEIAQLDGFIEYDLQTHDGKVDVVKGSYKYTDGAWEKGFENSYVAESWYYTDEGYLMFSGTWFSETLYALTLSSAEDHAAFRVEPLDEKCRELNRKYLLPVSYKQNNMFLVDWNESDFGELDFYDMYDIFYEQLYAKHVPYAADDNLGVGAVYQIPKEEFENVIMTYFNIDSETLQSKTTYDSVTETYEYKPRGFHEVEYPEYPYSEVIDYTENSDGTIALMVNVVFPYAGDSKVYVHEVTVRPLDAGGVQYVSNQIIFSEDKREKSWHTPRLTEEEWEEIYGDSAE